MAADDGHASLRTQAVKIGTTTNASVSYVRQIGIGHVADSRTGRAVIRAVLGPKTWRNYPMGGSNHILYARVACTSGSAEVRRGAHRLGSELRLPRTRRRRTGIVMPDTSQYVGGIACRVTCAMT